MAHDSQNLILCERVKKKTIFQTSLMYGVEQSENKERARITTAQDDVQSYTHLCTAESRRLDLHLSIRRPFQSPVAVHL